MSIRVFNPDFLKIKMVEMDDLLKSPSLLSIARNLSKGPFAGMCSTLDKYTELSKVRSVDALGLFAHYLGEVVGWLLFTYEDDAHCFTRKEGEACTHIFVHPNYRRLGIGTRLQKVAAKIANPDVVRVYEHNNYLFFKQAMSQASNLRDIY